MVIGLLLLTVPSAEAQETPPKHLLVPRLSAGATATHAADLTGDGRPDLVSGSRSDGSLVWRENKGGGALSDPRTIGTGLGKVESVYVADLNGNGDPDVLATDSTAGQVVWYEQDADGSFSSKNVITGDVQSPHSIHAADLTGNGQIDVLSASEEDGKIAWYENLGGAFSDQKVITGAASNARSVRAADVDGDGDLDVLTGSGNEIAWHENTGESFGGRTVVNSSANGIQSVRVADLTGNGTPDILAGITGILGAGKVIWHENVGSSGFSAEKELASDAGDVQSVAASDLNGDGNLDVISAQVPQDLDQGPQIAWSENLGNGSFSDQTVVSTAESGESLSELALTVADMDGDDAPDITFGFDRSDAGDDGRIDWYRNQLSAPGSISWQKAVLTPQRTRNVRTVRAADLTGDGEKEVLSGSDGIGGSPQIAWYPNPRTGAATQYLIDTDLQGPESLHAADLDGDGDQDVLAITDPPTTTTESKVVWYENGGGGAFIDRTVLTTNVEGGTSVYARDLTGSGAMDVLTASEDDGKIAWHEGEGEGGFSAQKTITTDASGAQSVEAGDLNGDGDPDILFATGSGDEVAWIENEGNGSFSGKKVITTDAESARSVHAADFTDNGRLDVVSASRGDRKIAWYENQGSGTFSSQKVITTVAHEARSVHAADFTGNGLPDIVSASQEEESRFGSPLGHNKIAWYKNQGGSFSTQRVLTTDIDDPESVFATDVGGDERPDVLFAAEGSREVGWLENTNEALPVELAALEGTASGKKVRLSWQTASETNNAGFEVQRKTDAKDEGSWTEVGFVESKASGGTTSSSRSYQFVDADLPYEADRLTYRLRQVDTDGSFSFSKRVTIERSDGELKLLGTSPNPAQSQAKVRYALPEPRDVRLELYDALGREVHTILQGKQEGRNVRHIDVSDLPSGTYFLRLQADGRVRTQKLMVMR